MSSIASKKQEADLSWDAFPAPPPEAANWKPNPDLIARPGEFKDPRFNKDPQAERKRAAIEREMRFRGQNRDLKDSSGLSTPSMNSAGQPAHRGLRKLPTTSVRSTYPTTLVNSKPSPTSAAAPLLVSTVAISPKTLTPTRGQPLHAHTPHIVPTRADVTSMEKRTMGDLPVMPAEYNRTRPLALPSFQPQSALIDKAIMPTWTGPLEKLLAEGMASEHSPSTRPATTSMTPHKRKSESSQADPCDLDAQFRMASEASRRVSSTSASDTVVNGESGTKDSTMASTMPTESLNHVKEDAELQDQVLFDHGDSEANDFSAEYQRSLKIALVKHMEGELDLGSHGTKAELRTLDDQVFKMYFDKVQTAHKQLWLAEKLKKKQFRPVE